MVLGSLDDYFVVGYNVNVFSTYMYMDKKQYSTLVTRIRAIQKAKPSTLYIYMVNVGSFYIGLFWE